MQDYETQAEMLNRQLAIEIARNNKAGITALDAGLNKNIVANLLHFHPK